MVEACPADGLPMGQLSGWQEWQGHSPNGCHTGSGGITPRATMQWLLLLLILAGLPWLYVLVNRYVLYPWRARNDPLEVEPVHTPIELTTVSPEAAERLTAVARELASCGFIA